MSYKPKPAKSGRVIGEDGSIINLVDVLGGGVPLSDKVYDPDRYPAQSGRVIGEDGRVYSMVQLLQNAGGGGGPTHWNQVSGKPNAYPPEDHNHDGRYYTQEQIDSPGFLASRVDNQTITVEGSELKAKALDGLSLTPTQINALLQGGQDNIPTQIHDLYMTLAALSAGMRYLGKFESHADLQSIGNKDNGDLAVVLEDETRNGVRSMYVYNDSLGIWDFIGAFEFADTFTALADTPNAYEDGKLLRSGANGLHYGDVHWGEIQDKPSSTTTQIDDAVAKRHTHANRDNLDKISESAGVLTYNGERYVRVSDLPSLQSKQRLFAYRSDSDQTLTAGTDCVFNTQHSGDIPYDTNTGIFTLEAGKLYRVEVAGSLYTSGWVILQLVNAETNSIVNTISRGIWMSVNPSNSNWHESSAGPLKTYIVPAATRGYKIRATSVSGESSLRSNFMSLEIVEI